MPFELLAQYLKLPVFALVASRLGGLLMLQPVLAATSVPMQVRALLVLGLAALLTPLVSLPADAPDNPLDILLAMAWEVLLGAMIGLLTAACFIGLQMGGLLIAQESGMAFGHIVDPTFEDEEAVVSVFYLQLALVVYLVIGGHRALVTACLDTFQTIPLLSSHPTALASGPMLCRALSLSGHVALRVAGPTLLALFLVNLALGFLSRTMPQLNILAVGFSLKALVAFLLMAVSLPSATEALIAALQQGCAWINQLVGTEG